MENFTTHTLENNVITVLIETAWSNLHSQCPFFYSLQAMDTTYRNVRGFI
jgi:hypothetical protein